MQHSEQKVRVSLAEGAQSIAIGAWLVAAVCLPAALLLRSYGLALLIVILVAFWQLLAVLTSVFLPAGPGRTPARFRYRLTAYGFVYCGIAAVFLIIAYQWGLNLIYMTAAFLASGALYTLLFTRLTLSRLRSHWELPGHAFAGTPFSVRLTVRNEKRMLGAFGLSVVGAGNGHGAAGARHITHLPPRGERSMLVQQHLGRRGLHRLPPISLRTTFPLGLVETTMETECEEEVLVLPRLGRIREDTLRRQKGGEARWLLELKRKDQQGEFRSLREYQPGDDPRHIHWPTTARLKKLHVREFERREMYRLLILLDTYMPPGDGADLGARLERFEHAVSFTATLVAGLTESNVFHAFAACCPELVALPYDLGPGHYFSVLETLALAEPTGEHTVQDLARALSYHEVSTGGICLVSPGPVSAGEARQALGPLSARTVVIDVSEPEFDEVFTY
jgi:uncharacterized protein (DUF58 family)